MPMTTFDHTQKVEGWPCASARVAQEAPSRCIVVGARNAGRARDVSGAAWEDGVRERPREVPTSVQVNHQ